MAHASILTGPNIFWRFYLRLNWLLRYSVWFRQCDNGRCFASISGSRKSAAEYLGKHELVLPMAKDIVRNGLNPLELFGLLPDGKNAYFAVEGNRRLCAIKLLNDPDLAPANQRNEFRKASENCNIVKEVFSVVFQCREEIMRDLAVRQMGL